MFETSDNEAEAERLRREFETLRILVGKFDASDH
jgi:hypothetical protein